MDTSGLLADMFDRIQEEVHAAVDGLDAADLAWRPDPGANSIAWLVWHLTRVQDDHVAEVAGRPQAWTEDGWYDRFDLPFGPADHGYGQSSEQVEAVRVESPKLLTGYHDAVHDRTVAYVGSLSDDDLDRVVDTNWDPPVTLGVRLVSVIADDLQHVGQAAYVAGLRSRG
jgi:uncharacterized damage-inducible protein DinB